jgi:hypothetical protein
LVVRDGRELWVLLDRAEGAPLCLDVHAEHGVFARAVRGKDKRLGL